MSPFLETTSTKRRRRMTLPAVHASDVNNGVEEPVLTDQQQSIVAKIKEGKSLFFTGSAGERYTKRRHDRFKYIACQGRANRSCSVPQSEHFANGILPILHM